MKRTILWSLLALAGLFVVGRVALSSELFGTTEELGVEGAPVRCASASSSAATSPPPTASA